MKAKDIMTRDVITVKPETPINGVAKIISRHKISGAPVVNDAGVLVGIITGKDLIQKVAKPHLPPHINLLGSIIFLADPRKMKEEYRKLFGITAEDIMTKPVHSVDEDAEVDEVANLMIEKEVNRIPILSNGKLVGIITRADIIRTLATDS